MSNESAIETAFDDHVGYDVSEPERNLMRAVLRSAMEDVKKNGEAHRDAMRFLNSDDDGYLYSFASICNHLGICPRTIRRVLGLRSDSNERIAA